MIAEGTTICKNGRNISNPCTLLTIKTLELCSCVTAFKTSTTILSSFIMKTSVLVLSAFLFSVQFCFAQQNVEDEIRQLSKDKWQWMADKNVDKLEPLFDSKSKFVHMSGTWKKDEELDIIKTGRIWYKNTTVHDTAVEVSGNTAIIWSRITLEAIVRGAEAKTEFTVTEVYQKQGKNWKILALTFSSVRDTHEIKK